MPTSPPPTSPPIRPATDADLEPMLALLPRLADFALPPGRIAAHLWEGDAALLRQWAAGGLPEGFVLVASAVGATEVVVDGLAFVRLQPEPLSHEASAHLEVLVVATHAEGRGLGAALTAAAEAEAVRRGATSMTLHAFANNTRARRLYERAGFTGEIIRYIKDI